MDSRFLGYVYLIKCHANNKGYIGITNNPSRRWDKHISDARLGSHYALHSAMRKYGLDNFSMDLIYVAFSKEELCAAEQKFIIQFNTHTSNKCGYNETFGGEAPMLNKRHTDKTKQMMSQKKKGKSSPNKGRKYSSHTRQLISKANSRSVVQLDLDGNIVAVHQSIIAAGLAVNIAGSNISGVCRNKKNTAGGFRWQYYEDIK